MIYEDDCGFLMWMEEEYLDHHVMDCVDAMNREVSIEPYYTSMGGCAE